MLANVVRDRLVPDRLITTLYFWCVSRTAHYERLLCGDKYGIMDCWIVPIPELQLDIPFDTLQDANVKIFFQQLR
jgi:hypothetical protein